MTELGRGAPSAGRSGDDVDLAILVTAPPAEAELLGAVLMERLGPFEIIGPFEMRCAGGLDQGPTTGAVARGDRVTMVFYPPAGSISSKHELLQSLPPGLVDPRTLEVEIRGVQRGWADNWREHFRPVVIGAVRLRPPWEPPLEEDGGSCAAPPWPRRSRPAAVDVVISPGLGFGTGLHPTTRGTLRLLQVNEEESEPDVRPGRLVDAGTGSGVLAIAAAKLGFQPVVAFDNDPAALVSARQNLEANGVEDRVELHEVDLVNAAEEWFGGATVLANLTLEPVRALLGRFVGAPTLPVRVVVSGILAGEQEREVLGVAAAAALRPRRRLYEAEWLTLELLPVTALAAGKARSDRER